MKSNNLIKRIIKKRRETKYLSMVEKEMEDLYNRYDFIWGIRSNDDFSGNETGLFTLNDFAILYDKEIHKYYMEIETIYNFANGQKGELVYLKNILNQFEQWLEENNYDLKGDVILNYHTVFQGWNACDKTGYDSILELYYHFKIMVEGYCILCNFS